jgi:hypothetical protein
MKPPMPLLENRHVERVLSLLIILYGSWLIVSGIEILIRAIMHGWNPFGNAVPKVIVGFLLIIFFSIVVQGICSVATRVTIRSQRRWSACEILALPIVLVFFAYILSSFFIGLFMITLFFSDWTMWQRMGSFSLIFIYTFIHIAVIVLILSYARSITAWLLRIVDSGYSIHST